MKNLTILVVTGVLAIVLVISGCSGEKERLVQKVLAQADTISALHRDLQWKSDSLRTASVKLSVTSAALDSQMQAQAKTAKTLRQVAARLSKANHDYERLEASKMMALAQKDSTLFVLDSAFADTSTALVVVRGKCGQLADQLRDRNNLISKVRPWYYKWRHDATERSFVEVLFGSDKAKSPDYPEPESDFRTLEAVPDTNSGQVISEESVFRNDN
jgi:septal ring factor EnvC (AmiA/AmiB activator)